MDTNANGAATPMYTAATRCPTGMLDSSASARENGLDARVLVSQRAILEYAAWAGNRDHMMAAARDALAGAGADVTLCRLHAFDDTTNWRKALVMQVERTSGRVPTLTISLPSELDKLHVMR